MTQSISNAVLPPKKDPPTKKSLVKAFASIIKQFKPKPTKEIVAGGDILWKPVDKQAALLLAKSPELNQPPKTMSKIGLHHPASEPNLRAIKNDDPNGKVYHTLVKKSDELPQKLSDHLDVVKMAKASLDVATDLFRSDMISFCEELPKHTEKLRAWRMMVEREKDMSLKALRELRQFFLESEHEREMMRLNEFVSMAERLAKLAKDGTLEKVADVMLKLA